MDCICLEEGYDLSVAILAQGILAWVLEVYKSKSDTNLNHCVKDHTYHKYQSFVRCLSDSDSCRPWRQPDCKPQLQFEVEAEVPSDKEGNNGKQMHNGKMRHRIMGKTRMRLFKPKVLEKDMVPSSLYSNMKSPGEAIAGTFTQKDTANMERNVASAME